MTRLSVHSCHQVAHSRQMSTLKCHLSSASRFLTPQCKCLLPSKTRRLRLPALRQDHPDYVQCEQGCFGAKLLLPFLSGEETLQTLHDSHKIMYKFVCHMDTEPNHSTFKTLLVLTLQVFTHSQKEHLLYTLLFPPITHRACITSGRHQDSDMTLRSGVTL